MSSDTVSVDVPVSGVCGGCGQINYTTITTSAPRGSTAHAVATGVCGDASCGASITMTGSVTVA